MPGPVFVVVEAEFVLGRLNAVLDCPAVAFNLHERVDPSPGHAPSHEERQFAVHNMSSDQQAASAQPGASFTGIGGLNVCKFDIGPVVQSHLSCPHLATGDARRLYQDPMQSHLQCRKQRASPPRAKVMVGADTKGIAFRSYLRFPMNPNSL